MKNMLKNKAVIGLFVLMLGFVYIKGVPSENINLEKIEEKDAIVYKNN